MAHLHTYGITDMFADKTSLRQRLACVKLDTSYWGTKIIRAEERGGFTKVNVRDAKDWVTCACGKQNELLPRYPGGAPEDKLLRENGNKFYNAVLKNEYLKAAMILISIEYRVKKVLAENLEWD